MALIVAAFPLIGSLTLLTSCCESNC